MLIQKNAIQKIVQNDKTYWIIGVVYLLYIAYASLRPIPLITEKDIPLNGIDKVLHCTAYALAGLWFGGLSSNIKKVSLGLFVFGFSMEIGQYFVPTRSFQLTDLVANLSGIILGLLLARHFKISWPQIFLKFLAH